MSLKRQVSFYDDLSVIQFTEEALESEGLLLLILEFVELVTCYLFLYRGIDNRSLKTRRS